MFLLMNNVWLIVILCIYSGNCDELDESQFSIGDSTDNSGWVDPTNPLTYDIGTQTNLVFGDAKSPGNDIVCPECNCDQSGPKDSVKCDLAEEKLSQCEKKYQNLQKRFESTSCDKLGYQILRRIIFMVNDISHRRKVSSQHLVILPSNLDEFIGNITKITKKLEKNLDCHCLHDFDRVIGRFLASLDFKIEEMEHSFRSFENWKPSHEFIYTGLVLGSILVLFAVLRMFVGSKIPFALILVFICCSCWEWLRLYQTEVAKQRHVLETSHRECSKSQSHGTIISAVISKVLAPSKMIPRVKNIISPLM